MELIEVTARFDEQGTITPLEFSWKGSLFRVVSTGRHWRDVDGLHILAMVASGRIYELTFKGEEGRWYIARAAPDRSVV